MRGRVMRVALLVVLGTHLTSCAGVLSAVTGRLEGSTAGTLFDSSGGVVAATPEFGVPMQQEGVRASGGFAGGP